MKIGTGGIHTDDNGFAALETLLARAEPFVLLDDERSNGEAHEHSPEEKKQLSLWMKRHKTSLRSFVKAQIHIEPDVTKQQAAKAFARMFEAFWGYPLLVEASREDALKLAHRLLAQ